MALRKQQICRHYLQSFVGSPCIGRPATTPEMIRPSTGRPSASRGHKWRSGRVSSFPAIPPSRCRVPLLTSTFLRTWAARNGQAVIADGFQNYGFQQHARMPVLSAGAVVPLLRAMPHIPRGLLRQSTLPGVGRSERREHYLGQAQNHTSIIAIPRLYRNTPRHARQPYRCAQIEATGWRGWPKESVSKTRIEIEGRCSCHREEERGKSPRIEGPQNHAVFTPLARTDLMAFFSSSYRRSNSLSFQKTNRMAEVTT